MVFNFEAKMKSCLFHIFTYSTLCLFCSCTVSVTIVHTEGTASDVVDEDQKTDADIEPQLNIPASVV